MRARAAPQQAVRGKVNKRTQRWIDLTGLNLIRIVIGSYFMAVALGLVSGIAPYALFPKSVDPQLADLIGSTFLFAVTAAFMIGLHLRISALTLALFILCTSLMQNLVTPDTMDISAFWRDLAMLCGVLLSYFGLKRHEFGKATVLWRRKTLQENYDASVPVRPRRISMASANAEGSPAIAYKRSLAPLIETPRRAAPDPAGDADPASNDEPLTAETVDDPTPAQSQPAIFRRNPAHQAQDEPAKSPTLFDLAAASPKTVVRLPVPPARTEPSAEEDEITDIFANV